MLTFLRKIRKSLIESGSARKYVLYAIGEILLIVVGIMIALQINNANQRKQDRSFEIKMLNDIRNDLVNDIHHINTTVSWIQCSEFAAQTFLKATDANIDSLFDTYFGYFEIGNDILLETHDGAYEALKNSGLDKISNDTLRAELVRYYDFNQFNSKKGIERSNNMNGFVIDQLLEDLTFTEKKIDQNGQLRLVSSLNQDTNIRSSKLLRLIQIIQRKNTSNLSWLNGLRGSNEYLLQQLNKELTESFPLILIGPSAIQSVGIIGSATEGAWETDMDMADEDQDGIYTIVADLTNGEVKFRANDSWIINWGCDWRLLSFPIGAGRQDGHNIAISEGKYMVSLDIHTGFYQFETLD